MGDRSIRAGYEVIRVPLHQTNRATGEYEDFLTGFVFDNGRVWGRRRLALQYAKDGSLLVSDDGSNSIWRVSYTSTESQQSVHHRSQPSQGTKSGSK